MWRIVVLKKKFLIDWNLLWLSNDNQFIYLINSLLYLSTNIYIYAQTINSMVNNNGRLSIKNSRSKYIMLWTYLYPSFHVYRIAYKHVDSSNFFNKNEIIF